MMARKFPPHYRFRKYLELKNHEALPNHLDYIMKANTKQEFARLLDRISYRELSIIERRTRAQSATREFVFS